VIWESGPARPDSRTHVGARQRDEVRSDANDVSIFGNSAGSIDASVLMTSPMSKGLFRRVIGESGTVIPASVNPLARPQAEKLRRIKDVAGQIRYWNLHPALPRVK
jgi:hypothetical protein